MQRSWIVCLILLAVAGTTPSLIAADAEATITLAAPSHEIETGGKITAATLALDGSGIAFRTRGLHRARWREGAYHLDSLSDSNRVPGALFKEGRYLGDAHAAAAWIAPRPFDRAHFPAGYGFLSQPWVLYDDPLVEPLRFADRSGMLEEPLDGAQATLGLSPGGRMLTLRFSDAAGQRWIECYDTLASRLLYRHPCLQPYPSGMAANDHGALVDTDGTDLVLVSPTGRWFMTGTMLDLNGEECRYQMPLGSDALLYTRRQAGGAVSLLDAEGAVVASGSVDRELLVLVDAERRAAGGAGWHIASVALPGSVTAWRPTAHPRVLIAEVDLLGHSLIAVIDASTTEPVLAWAMPGQYQRWVLRAAMVAPPDVAATRSAVVSLVVHSGASAFTVWEFPLQSAGGD